MRMKVRFWVDWDTDPGVEVASDFEAMVDFEDVDTSDSEEMTDYLSDWLSDTYGFCHNGFNWEVVEYL